MQCFPPGEKVKGHLTGSLAGVLAGHKVVGKNLWQTRFLNIVCDWELRFSLLLGTSHGPPNARVRKGIHHHCGTRPLGLSDRVHPYLGKGGERVSIYVWKGRTP